MFMVHCSLVFCRLRRLRRAGKNLPNLLGMTVGMHRHHQQHFVIVDCAEDRMFCDHRTRVLQAILNELNRLAPRRQKVVVRLLERRKTISRLRAIRRFDSSLAVDAPLQDRFFSRDVDHWSLRGFGTTELREKVLFRERHVFRAFENRPPAGSRTSPCGLLAHACQHLCKRFWSRLQVLNDFNSVFDVHCRMICNSLFSRACLLNNSNRNS